jgi:hypothetical protein
VPTADFATTTTPDVTRLWIYQAEPNEKAAALQRAAAALRGLSETKDDHARQLAIRALEAALNALKAEQSKPMETKKDH